MIALQREGRAAFAFVERNLNLTKRYWAGRWYGSPTPSPTRCR